MKTFLQYVRHKVGYGLICAGKQTEHVLNLLRLRKKLWFALYNYMYSILVWLLYFSQHIYVVACVIHNHSVN